MRSIVSDGLHLILLSYAICELSAICAIYKLSGFPLLEMRTLRCPCSRHFVSFYRDFRFKQQAIGIGAYCKMPADYCGIEYVDCSFSSLLAYLFSGILLIFEDACFIRARC